MPRCKSSCPPFEIGVHVLPDLQKDIPRAVRGYRHGITQLVDSGISLCVWTNAKFLSIVMYTCKGFDEKKAVEETKRYFGIDQIESKSF